MSPLGMHNSSAWEPTTKAFIPSDLAPQARASGVFVSVPKELAAGRDELEGGLQAFLKGEKKRYTSMLFTKKPPHIMIYYI